MFNLTELLKFKTGCKFILEEEYANKEIIFYNSTPELWQNTINLPKGLIFSIASIKLTSASQSMKCKIIRSSKIIDSIYDNNNIDPKFYTPIKINGRFRQFSHVKFKLSGDKLFTFLQNAKVEDFTYDYTWLHRSKQS